MSQPLRAMNSWRFLELMLCGVGRWSVRFTANSLLISLAPELSEPAYQMKVILSLIWCAVGTQKGLSDFFASFTLCFQFSFMTPSACKSASFRHHPIARLGLLQVVGLELLSCHVPWTTASAMISSEALDRRTAPCVSWTMKADKLMDAVTRSVFSLLDWSL